MTEQDYAKAAENFERALSLLTSKIGTLSKPPLKVPPINAGSDDAEKRKALRDMLKSLASTDDAAVLSQDDIRRASNFFVKLYGGGASPIAIDMPTSATWYSMHSGSPLGTWTKGSPIRSTASPRTFASSMTT